MEWPIKLTIYLVTILITFVVMYQIDYNKIMRINKNSFAVLVWIIISLALGYLIGSLLVVLGEQLRSI